MKNKGFSLIEVMIVLAILGGLLALVMPRLNRDKNNVTKVIREIAVLGKEVRNQARVKGATHRLVMNIGPTESTYWVEMANGSVLRKSKEEFEQEAKENNEKLSDEQKKDAEAAGFQKSTKFFKEDRKVPKGINFVSVETPSAPEPITSGTAYVYFNPEGLVEHAAIQISNKEKQIWTLIFNPLTGHADIMEKAVSLKDVTKQ